jgi:SAM-dependent methyltransferase
MRHTRRGSDGPASSAERLGHLYDDILAGAVWKADRDPERFLGIDAPLVGVARGRVLELGCGFGRLLDKLRPTATLLVGVDVSQANLAVAREKGHGVVRASALSLPFADEAFDAVVAGFGTLAHLPLGPALHEAARVVAPGGWVGFHTFGRRALDLARVVHGVVRLRRPHPPTTFHAHAIRRPQELSLALRGAGLSLVRIDCHLHAPGMKRVLRRRPVVHVPWAAPWSWDVVVVSRKGEAQRRME